MMTRRAISFGLPASLAAAHVCSARSESGPQTLANRFPPPAGFERPELQPRSFGDWLRHVQLLPDGQPVLLHTGQPKLRQDIHAAVLNIDVGSRDLQQCADAIMRLRAEWLFAAGRAHEVAFNDTGAGKPMAFSRWAAGERPQPDGRKLVWRRTAAPDASYASFRRYLDSVFAWAGTHSLEQELVPVTAREITAGDVIIRGGFPGHAVLAVDLAVGRETGERRVLLVQSFMPAQSIHVLKNPAATDGSPWYRITDSEPVTTPEWQFPGGSLRRWRV